ncbi:MAG TPA: ABC transporter ATP-binding protein [Candidatus Eisenbacteria bacterium]|nr:ABC transporter ATP-binding protein [Candidatus Eisenbacteria bacterium]
MLKYDIGSEIEPLTVPMIAVRGLTKVFPGGTADLSAVSEVSFDLEPGIFAAITGPSGSGKSTLLHLLGGIEKPTSGEIHVAGKEIQALGESELATFRLTQVGFIFQAFHLIPNLTIFNNVAMPGLLAGFASGPLRTRVMTLLETVGIRDKADRLPHELSGGQQQRAAIARALVNDPQVILADEPTGNLDSAAGEAVLQLLGELNDRGKTLLMVTHDPRIASWAGRQLRMRDGRLLTTADGGAAQASAPQEP